MKKHIDDKFMHLESDIDKLRLKHRMYVSTSNEDAALSISLEALYNAIDECKNPDSPGNSIQIIFDKNTGILEVMDNGRGIPLEIFEKILTTLNSGSNIDDEKASKQITTLGRNGVGTIALTALGEVTEFISFRGNSSDGNVFRHIIFKNGEKVSDKIGTCKSEQHGLHVKFKADKTVLGKNTRLKWEDFKRHLINFQFMNKSKINMKSIYYDIKGNKQVEKYPALPFKDIVQYNNPKGDLLTPSVCISHRASINEELATRNKSSKSVKKFIAFDLCLAMTVNYTNPYIDSFANSNNTIDNGSHVDAAIEGICRYLQNETKSKISSRENLDIKWDDIKQGLSLVISVDSNIENMFTNQSKHKIVNDDVFAIVKTGTMEKLAVYFNENPNHLKSFVSAIKSNAKARREGDKARSAIVKDSISRWNHKIETYDPCINKGNQYKELFIIEGASAKGTLKNARFPEFQALYQLRGVPKNAHSIPIDKLIGKNGNKEYNDLITILRCNIGSKFDIRKLYYDKIIIATDADVDGVFIRALLLSTFWRFFPEIILEGRLYIAEPPLYRINDKKDPFVINRQDYLRRYIKSVMSDYRIGYKPNEYMSLDELEEFLELTFDYVTELETLAKHYHVPPRMLELIFENIAETGSITINNLLNNIRTEYPEISYNEEINSFTGIIDNSYRMIELSGPLLRRKYFPDIMRKLNNRTASIILTDIKHGIVRQLPLYQLLKIITKYQPDINHRFKGLGENDWQDIRKTVMDPNTRVLIKVIVEDITKVSDVLNMLRGHSPLDRKAKRELMRNAVITKDMIDT